MNKAEIWLKDSLDYQFNDSRLLEQSLTHRSASGHNNERLEFLGDAVLDFVVSDVVFHSHPQAPEGDLSKLRASLVNDASLAQLAANLGIGEHLILGSGGPITIPPHETLLIGRDGTISIRPLGQSATTLAAVDRIRLVAPPLQSLRKGEDGLFRLPPGELAEPDARVNLVGGTLEGSNVNTVDALVQMIELARAFESQVKLMDVTERNDEASASVMRVS